MDQCPMMTCFGCIHPSSLKIRFLGRSMAAELANEKEGSTKVPKNLDNWKFPKIPVCKIYKKHPFRIFPSYAIDDFEKTITLTSDDKLTYCQLLPEEYLGRFIKKQHEFLHLGLVQVAIKPLIRNGLEDVPVLLCLRDARHLDFDNSLLALVESNLSQGPFYFNCFPSFSVSLEDTSTFEALTFIIKTTGIPLALTFRIVCKAMVNLSSEYLGEPMLGKTTYFHATSGTPAITNWDEVKDKVTRCGPEPARPPRGV